MVSLIFPGSWTKNIKANRPKIRVAKRMPAKMISARAVASTKNRENPSAKMMWKKDPPATKEPIENATGNIS